MYTCMGECGNERKPASQFVTLLPECPCPRNMCAKCVYLRIESIVHHTPREEDECPPPPEGEYRPVLTDKWEYKCPTCFQVKTSFIGPDGEEVRFVPDKDDQALAAEYQSMQSPMPEVEQGVRGTDGGEAIAEAMEATQAADDQDGQAQIDDHQDAGANVDANLHDGMDAEPEAQLDEEGLEGKILQILSNADSNAITKRIVRAKLEEIYGRSLEAHKAQINDAYKRVAPAYLATLKTKCRAILSDPDQHKPGAPFDISTPVDARAYYYLKSLNLRGVKKLRS